MFIQNVFSINNYNKNSINNNSIKKSNPNFTGNITKEIQLTTKEFQQVSEISEWYDKILKIFTSLSNGLYQTKFKALYPNLVSGEKIKGFVFNSFKELKNKNLQIVKFNTKENSDELLTFSILDKNNKNLLRYRINKLGKATISAEEENLSNLSVNPFQQNAIIDYDKLLNSFQAEIENLGFYSENFKDIYRKTLGRASVDFSQAFSKVKSFQKSSGINVEDIVSINDNYANLNQIINAKNGKDALSLKQLYFGSDFSSKTKGLVFKNIGPHDNIVSFCPLFSKDDNRIFKIVIMDKNKNPENALVFFDDGKVAKQKILNLETNGYRPNNLEFISDEEIQDLGLKNILSIVNTKISDFKNFVIEKRNILISEKNTIRENNRIKKEAREQKILEEKRIKKEEKARIKEEAKEQKILEEKRIKEEKKAKNLEQQQLKKQAKEEMIRLKEMHKEQLKLEKQSETSKVEKRNPNINKHSRIAHFAPSYKNFLLTDLIDALTKLFDTPVEKRSPHLIHEKLANGNIFAGRFYVKAQDGSNITVSKIKSPKYVDFTYYSIKIEKDGKEFVMNIDSTTGKIISSKNGKPIIDSNNNVLYISKDKFFNKNPESKNLSKYLNEIFEIKSDGKREIVNSSLKFKNQEKLLKQKEEDILEALEQNQDIDIFD